jgi:hypothetical protein
MRYSLPEGYQVRYDYHEHPHGITAVIIGPNRDVRAVGVAKHNPDDEWSLHRGRDIALGRALKNIATGKDTRRYFYPDGDVLDGRGLTPREFGASIADELV